ncbi:hypothetical protein OUZ56_008323 [Daphnia magna]|uniref:Tropomyosin n=1 Tax=Daphnia magna TaxID=35525 RepID=A0ABR0ACM3_9CRUS|nr:hypothetical protein OUZ56_008323 [Daphnia magna]
MSSQQGTLLDVLKKKMRQTKEEAEKYQEEAEEYRKKLQIEIRRREELDFSPRHKSNHQQQHRRREKERVDYRSDIFRAYRFNGSHGDMYTIHPAEGEVAGLNRRVQLLEEDLERSEERLNTATTKLAEASHSADESERIRKALENRTNMEDDRVAILEAQVAQAKLIAEEADKKYEEKNKQQQHGCHASMRKVLENRSLSDEERMDALENQLKEARFLAEEADRKYDEAS